MTETRNRSVMIVTVGVVLQMVAQFALQLVLARAFGAGAAMDAYVAAAAIPFVIAGTISAPLGAVLIPSLSRAQEHADTNAARTLAGQAGSLFLMTTLLLAALIAWRASSVVALVFPGVPAAVANQSAGLLAILAWLIPANTLTMFCQSFQNWQQRFFLPALAGVVGPVVTVILVVLLEPRMGIEAVAYGVLAGAVLNVGLQWPGMTGILWRVPAVGALRGLLVMMVPLLLSSIYIRVVPLVDRSLASNLDVGVISYLGYSDRIINALLAVTSGTLSVVAFPFLTAAAAQGRNELAREVARTLRMVVFVAMPFLVAFLLFAPEIVRDLFERGEFVGRDTLAVATLIRWSLGILLGASIGEIVARAFYADHSIWPPVIIGSAALTLAIIAKVLLVDGYGAVALVGASSIGYCLSGAVMVIVLWRRLGRDVFDGVAMSILVSGVCATGAALVGWLLMSSPLPFPAICGGIGGGVVYVVAAVFSSTSSPRREPGTNRILFLTSGSRIPSTRFRVWAYLPYLRSQGVRCAAWSGFPHKYDHLPWLGFRPSQWLKRIVRYGQWLAARVMRYDVVFVERELFNDGTWSMEDRFRRIAPRMVLDVDDAVFLSAPEKFEHLARISDLVIVGNPQIDRRIQPWNANTSIIPTSIELARYCEQTGDQPANDMPLIGWMGTTANLEYLLVIAEALRHLATMRDFELRLIAPDIGPLQGIDLTGVDVRHIVWSGETEVTELSKIDIGVMPLFPDREWDAFKCPTKLVQYMALGIPAVASPVGFTGDVVTDGVDGFHSTGTDQWVQTLCRLIDDAELRARIGRAARRTAAEKFSVEANAPQLLAALTGMTSQPDHPGRPSTHE